MSQTMFRVQKDKANPYVMLNKGFLNDPCLSMKAKGLLAYFLSLPDDWQIYESEIIKHHKDGKSAFKATIKELEQNGYVERDRLRDEKGHLRGYKYSVYEHPIHVRKSNVGKSNVGKSDLTNKENKLNNKSNMRTTSRQDEIHKALIDWAEGDTDA